MLLLWRCREVKLSTDSEIWPAGPDPQEPVDKELSVGIRWDRYLSTGWVTLVESPPLVAMCKNRSERWRGFDPVARDVDIGLSLCSPIVAVSSLLVPEGAYMQVHYLEIVTPEVDAACATLENLHDMSFGERVAELGDARMASLPDGSTIGVRAPMHEAEAPVVRPYRLVEDAAVAAAAAEAGGAEILHPPMLIPGHGTFAIYLQGGVQFGLWQL